MRTAIAALALVAGARGAMADTYADCVALAEADPARAEVEAQRWERAGGGAAARHCRALALLAQGAEASAAKLMVEIAGTERTLPDEVRAEMLVEAGDIYLGLGALAPAREAATQALRLARDPRPALTLSARLKAEAEDWRGAVADLDAALARGAPDAGLLVLRASARRHLGDRRGAGEDLRRAADIAPHLPSVWLERGALAAEAGDAEAARAAWLKAIEFDRAGDGEGGGVVAEAARLRIQRLEAGGG
jgi:tetratricopeptide (TPR) repeat protein